MRIYLFLPDKLASFMLPVKKFGSYAFDADPEEDAKLINVEPRDGRWVLYSTDDVHVYYNNQAVENIELISNYYYMVERDNKFYFIFVTDGFEKGFSYYEYHDNLNLVIGKTAECNIQFACPFIKDIGVTIKTSEGHIVLEKKDDLTVYCNGVALEKNKTYILNGDTINIYGLKIMFFKNYLLMNSLGNWMNVNATDAHITLQKLHQLEQKKEINVKDNDLYHTEDYFSKSPRFRRLIQTKKITLSPPPNDSQGKDMPLLLTVGPMLTMAVMAFSSSATAITGLIKGTEDLSTAWPNLGSAVIMLMTIILWPTLTKKFNKKLEANKRKETIIKYKEYLETKRDELEKERLLQKEILIENVIPVETCLHNISVGRLNFWSKRIEQSDFLTVRLGIGNELLDVEVSYPEAGFSIDQDELREEADKMVEDFKYIEDVPLGYSLSKAVITGLMGVPKKQYGMIDNIILQLLSFYSYDDIKFVVFTNRAHEDRWKYMKYLNHTFSNNKDIRFFSSDYESAKKINDYLTMELQQRISLITDEKKNNPIFKPHYIIITDDYSQIKSLSFIKSLVEIEVNLGFSFIIMENTMSKMPSKCNNFISLGQNSSGVLRNSYEQQEQQEFQDEIKYNVDMFSIAQKISNIPIEFQEGSANLPDSITFLEMEKVGKVEQLNIFDRWNLNDSTQSLKAEVGVDSDGNLMYLDLHEKYHGPHGLIAGMTGSGKSEFIITYILSMCVNYSPDDVAFILIDYKGGGLAFAFENKTTGAVLPHLAGTITNLDKAEMDRTLVSIDSEVKRRQQLFNEARDKLGESTIDIYKYQGFYHEGKLTEPLPHLFIICDEFAELKSQQPDFMDNLISVARIGRSLGVHLILATQKPNGVVNDQIWSNTKFRVCLKVQDESDSKEMLKRPDAAYLKQTGRFYLQVGFDEYFALGQSGWAGAKYYPSEKIQKQVDKSVNVINNIGEFIKNIQEGNKNSKIEAQGEQLSAIMNNIIEVAERENKSAKKLWLENIPAMIYYDDLVRKYKLEFEENDVEMLLGEYDAPESQTQGAVCFRLKERGNTLIFGNDGEEKEKAITSMLYSAFHKYTAEDLNVYIVDYGSEITRIFSNYPQIGGLVFAGDDEKFKNAITLINHEINSRKKEFIPFGGSFDEYNKNSGKKLPQILFIINNMDGLAEAYPNFYEDLTSICRDCTRYGVYFIVSLNVVSSLSRRTMLCFESRIAYHFSDSASYSDIFDVRCKIKPRDMVGRGVVYSGGDLHEFQTFSISDEEHTDSEIVQKLYNEIKDKSHVTATKIPELPEVVTMDVVENDFGSFDKIPIGIYRESLKTAFIDFVNFPVYTISATRLRSMRAFVKSLMITISKIKGCTTIFVDVEKLVPGVKEYCRNYYDENFTNLVNELIKIESNPDNLSKKYIYVFFGLDKLKTKMSSMDPMEKFINLVHKNDHSHIIVLESAKGLRSCDYENWYTKMRNATDGLWIGKGFADQQVLRISNLTKDMNKIIPNNYGYLDSDSIPELVKIIEFTNEKEDDEDEE